MKEWERHEADVQSMLGLDSTSASGSQWHDPSDGVDRNFYDGNPFRLMVDCKSTIKGSYSVNAKFMRDWTLKAIGSGLRFALPIRFLNAGRQHEDYIVLTLDDFAELLMLAKSGVGHG